MAGHKSFPRSNLSLHPRGNSFPLNYPHQNPSIDDCFALHNKPFTYLQILNYLSLESSSLNISFLYYYFLDPVHHIHSPKAGGLPLNSPTVYTSSLNCGLRTPLRAEAHITIFTETKLKTPEAPLYQAKR